jgi:ribosome maturation factor RimP
MGKRSKIAQQAFDIAQPVAERMGYDLVDAEYKKEGSAMFLRLYIDKRGGVNSDDCEAFSKEVDPLIDAGTDSDADYFEVSSPGLTRPLETLRDYERYQGEKIDVKLFAAVNGAKNFTAEIASVSEDKVTLKAEDGNEYELGLGEISQSVRHIDF